MLHPKAPLVVSLLLTACLPPVPGSETGTGTDTGTSAGTEAADSSTSTSSATTTMTATTEADTTGGDLCTFHCFSAPPVSFPYNVDPVDENGDPSPTPLECDLAEGGTLSLLGTSFPIDEPACVSTQAVAETVEALGVCAPGVVPAPPPSEWETWASLYSTRQQRRCVDVLVEMGCVNSVPSPGAGAEEICNAYFRNQLRLDTLSVSPQLEEVDSLEAPPLSGVPCDYEDNLSCN